MSDAVPNAQFEQQERGSLSNDGNEVFSTVVENGKHAHSMVENGEHAHSMVENGQHAHSMVENGQHAHSMVENGQHAHSMVENGQHAHSMVENGQHAHSMVENGQHAHSMVENGEHAHSMVENGEHAHSMVENGEHVHSMVENGEHAHSMVENGEHVHSMVENGEHAHSEADEPDEPEVTATHQQCTLIISVCDMKNLSKVFKTFENSQAVIQHVESRSSQKKASKYEFLINFEAGKEDLQTVFLALKSSSAVTDVVIVKDAIGESVPWFPRHISDLDNCRHLLTMFDPDLHYDHPGFADKEYRERRKTIASLAYNYKYGMPIQTVEYLPHEIQTWGTVYRTLQEVYPRHACKEQLRNLRILERECGYSPQHIPQLQDVSNFLKKRTGFQLRPVAGLLTSRDFLASLAFRVFQCTQYVRHSSKPDHTVEPDCIHELLGHVPMLADPSFAQFSQEIGLASLGVSDADIVKFSTLFWFTIEFGLCRQDGQIKAYGAGLLSAFGELHHAMSDVPEVRPFKPETAAIQPYQDQDYQMVYYVADSFDDMREKVTQWSSQLKRPYTVRYDPYTQSVKLLNNRNSVQEVTRVLKAEITNLHNALDKIEIETR